MLLSDDQLRTILLGTGLIDVEKLDETAKLAKESEVPLAKLLVERDIIPDEHLGLVIADAIKFPFINLKRVAISEDVLKIIPEIVAKKQNIIAFERAKEGLKVAMLEPKNLEIKEFIEKKVGDEVVPYFATERDLSEALRLYRKDIKEEFADIIASAEAQAEASRGGPAEPSVRKIVETIINYAYQNRASDIHIEPHDEDSVVRFRIDGVLHDVVKISKSLHPQVVTLIKVMARLRTDERLAAQDGKIQYEIR